MDIFNSGSKDVIAETIPLAAFVLAMPAADVIRTLGMNTLFDSTDPFIEEGATVIIAAVSLGSIDWCVIPVPKGMVPET